MFEFHSKLLLLTALLIPLSACGLYANQQSDKLYESSRAGNCADAESRLSSVMTPANKEDPQFLDSTYGSLARCFGRAGNREKADYYSRLADAASGRASLRLEVLAGGSLCCCVYSEGSVITGLGPNFKAETRTNVVTRVTTSSECRAKSSSSCVFSARGLRNERYQPAIRELLDKCPDPTAEKLLGIQRQ
jgi:hypothetical protein